MMPFENALIQNQTVHSKDNVLIQGSKFHDVGARFRCLIFYLSLIFLNLQSIFVISNNPSSCGYHIRKGTIESIIPWASFKTPSFVIIWQNLKSN